MALDERYIPLGTPNPYFNDKDTGLPLSGGKVQFWRDSSRTTPKTVYELVNEGGTYEYRALPNPVYLTSAGTFQNGPPGDPGAKNVIVYLYPYINDPITNELQVDLYFVTCLSATDVPQWEREALPTITDANDPVDDGPHTSNALANPQFSRYFLPDDSTSLTVSANDTVFPIAPDWELVASGNGTIDIERIPVSGNEAIPTSPSHYLSIRCNAGITNPYLRQKFSKNSGLWSGVFVAGLVVAQADAGNNNLAMKYQDSSGVNSNVTIFTAGLTSSWMTFSGGVDLNDSTNTQSGNSAFVAIVVELPLGVRVDITSLQVIAVEGGEVDIKNYEERTANREQALMGDYFIPNLEEKSIPSLLVGWDFPKNPRQVAPPSGAIAPSFVGYIWDQTILQTIAGLNVNYGVNTKTNGLTINHQNPDLAYGLIQYLSDDDASKFIGSPLSVNINGYTYDGGNSAANTQVQVKIFANAANNQFGTLPTSLVTISADGTINLTPTAEANGWYEIERSNLPTATGTLIPLGSDGNAIGNQRDLKFNQWVVDDDTQVANGIRGVAVVVSFKPADSTTDYQTQIDSISVTPGNIPTRPAAMSFGQTLRSCQFFYEKSYNAELVPGPNFDTLARSQPVAEFLAPNDHLHAGRFEFEFREEKRTVPQIFTYTEVGAATVGNVLGRVEHDGVGVASGNVSIGNWAPLISKTLARYDGNGNIILNAPGAAASVARSGFVEFHYIADARIGIV